MGVMLRVTSVMSGVTSVMWGVTSVMSGVTSGKSPFSFACWIAPFAEPSSRARIVAPPYPGRARVTQKQGRVCRPNTNRKCGAPSGARRRAGSVYKGVRRRAANRLVT